MPDLESAEGATEEVTAASESTAEVTEDTAPATETTAESSTDSAPEESFFDPSALPPELMPGYKQMQGHFTRAMQQIKAAKDKIAAYDAFQSNPTQTIQQLAQRYGLTVQQAQAAQQAAEFDPQDWNDVTKHITDAVFQKLDPVINEIRSVKQTSIEAQLDQTMPEWREYEEPMKELMGRHPTLAEDPVMLAKLAIPDSVLQAKATQAALRKLEAKNKAASVTSGSATTKGANPLKPPPKGAPFQDYVEYAKRKLAAEQTSQ